MCNQYAISKRSLDIFVSFSLLAALWPLLCVLMLSIRINMGKGVLFQQVRPGLHGEPFVLYKLKTMLDLWDVHGKVLPDEMRLTRLGKLLRSLSVDEIPQLWNVLKGDMSLVGPRPLLMEYLALYTPDQARRHEVRPGITGWAQINGRNAISWEERFALDLWYIEHQSFWLDIRILVLTVCSIFRRHGIHAPGEATMHKFRGGR